MLFHIIEGLLSSSKKSSQKATRKIQEKTAPQIGASTENALNTAPMDPRAWMRFKKNKGALLGLGLVIFVSLFSLLGPLFAPHSPKEQFVETLLMEDGTPATPGQVAGFYLGADPIGRDELTRLLYGGRVSMQVAFISTAIAVFIGLLIGVTSGYFGGLYDFFSMRFVDFLLSLPFLLIAIAIHKTMDTPSLFGLYLILGFLSWTSLARVTRSKTMQVKQMQYIEAAKVLGLSNQRILLRHILPNVIGPAIVIGTTLVAGMIIAESAMSFLGLGVRPPTASWGSMLREGQEMMAHAPRLVLFPGIMIVLTVFGFNLLGEGLRDAFDPKDQ